MGSGWAKPKVTKQSGQTAGPTVTDRAPPAAEDEHERREENEHVVEHTEKETDNNTTAASRTEGEVSQPSNRTAWKEVLLKVADMDPWGGIKRETRAEWSIYLEQAEELLRSPRQPLPTEAVAAVISGDIQTKKDIPSIQKKIVVFVSSTFTDTKAERNLLMKDVYPYLRTVCRRLGLDFSPVDMRWGVNEETTLEHETVSVCLGEVERCIRESVGPAFLVILSHKYGFSPFPSQIQQEEFEKLLTSLKMDGEDIETLEEYFRLDTNAIPPAFILKAREVEQSDWWDVFNKMRKQLRMAALKCLTPQEAEKYIISVTEKEIGKGVFDGGAISSDHVVYIERDLCNIRDDIHKNRHLIDMEGGDIIEAAQEKMKELREKKMMKHIAADAHIEVEYNEGDSDDVMNQIRQVCDEVCQKLVVRILNCYRERLHTEDDDLYSELLQHRTTAQEKSSLFVGRDTLLNQISQYVSKEIDPGSNIFVVHGESGCGKTALMAVAASEAKKTDPNAVVVLRFLGTTSFSGSARSTLHSISEQITRAYDKPVTNMPTDYKELSSYFIKCLNFASKERPLLLFLDSLDQLSNEDFGRNLKWLPHKEKLPKNVRLIVSTLETQKGECLDVLNSFLPETAFLNVKKLGMEEGGPILDRMLSDQSRTVTKEQKNMLLAAFEKCPLPLYLRLAADIAVKWKSYETVPPDGIASDIAGLIMKLFERLESRYSSRLVHHALAYISAAKNGLSNAELEDILSCDDAVLDDIFEYWIPPFRRMPPFLWIRIKNELGPYLVERGGDGTSLYNWYHRQFWQTAEKRYLACSPDDNSHSFSSTATLALSEYFQGKWANGKLHVPTRTARDGSKIPEKMEDRQVPVQPLVLAGDRYTTRRFNLRLLSELPNALIKLENWKGFKDMVINLEFIEAKFVSGQGFDCLAEVRSAANLSGDKELASVSKFIGSSLAYLLHQPDCIFQLASQQVRSNPVRILFENTPKQQLVRTIVIDENPNEMEDPCEMTLRGHESGVRACEFSPDGKLIASTAEDGSMRLWDTVTGAEMVTVTGLPGPTYPALSYPHQGERPCRFHPEGDRIATGAEEGWVQVWDLTGAEIVGKQAHSGTVTTVVYSPNGKYLVSVSKDKTAKVWDSNTLDEVASISLPADGMGGDFPSDGSRLMVVCVGILVIVDANTWSVTSSKSTYTGYNICCSYSPDGKLIATGGDDCAVSLYGGSTGEKVGQLRGHKGWMWCTRFSLDGAHIFSCSSDRTIRVWDVLTRTTIAILGGHLHRVCYVSLQPPSAKKFVTSSFDFSMKIWNSEPVMAGKVPPVAGMHFSIMAVTPDCRFLVSCQGWSRCCSFTNTETREIIGYSVAHDYSMQAVEFTADSTKMICIDTGHGGTYEEGAEKNAVTKVSNIPNDGSSWCLSVYRPCCVAVNNHYIFIGTYSGKICVFSSESLEEVSSGQWDDSKINKIAASMSEPWLVTSRDRELLLWNIKTDGSIQQESTLPIQQDTVVSVIFSPDSKHLAIALNDGTVSILDTSQRPFCEKYRPTGHHTTIRDMAFSPDGLFLVTTAVEMCVRLWNVINGFTLHATYYGPVNYLAFAGNDWFFVGDATGNTRKLKFDNEIQEKDHGRRGR